MSRPSGNAQTFVRSAAVAAWRGEWRKPLKEKKKKKKKKEKTEKDSRRRSPSYRPLSQPRLLLLPQSRDADWSIKNIPTFQPIRPAVPSCTPRGLDSRLSTLDRSHSRGVYPNGDAFSDLTLHVSVCLSQRFASIETLRLTTSASHGFLRMPA